MKNFLLGLGVAAILVSAGFYLLKPATQPAQQLAGASSGNEHWNPEYFYNGLTYYKISGNMFNSSSTPAVLGTTTTPASVGHIVIAAGATSVNASSTAIDANSLVQVQLEQTTPIAGTTCNTNVNASSSEAVLVAASSTAPRLSGFVLTVNSAPVTNPFCFNYKVLN